MTEEKKIKFNTEKDKILSGYNYSKGIGTLSEKTLHKIIKFYLDNDEEHQEIKIDKYYADIMKDNTIYEIQTRSFNKLRGKLDVFLKEYKTYIVYPIPYIKWVYWINHDTGEITKKRKSPKKGSIYDCFYELYKIKPYLNNENIRLCLMLINMDEFKNLDGWNESKKRGSSRFDRVPLELVEEIYFETKDDYKLFIPETLTGGFTAKDYQKATNINIYYARIAVNILTSIGVLKVIGKDKKQNIYEVI